MRSCTYDAVWCEWMEGERYVCFHPLLLLLLYCQNSASPTVLSRDWPCHLRWGSLECMQALNCSSNPGIKASLELRFAASCQSRDCQSLPCRPCSLTAIQRMPKHGIWTFYGRSLVRHNLDLSREMAFPLPCIHQAMNWRSRDWI